MSQAIYSWCPSASREVVSGDEIVQRAHLCAQGKCLGPGRQVDFMTDLLLPIMRKLMAPDVANFQIIALHGPVCFSRAWEDASVDPCASRRLGKDHMEI